MENRKRIRPGYLLAVALNLGVTAVIGYLAMASLPGVEGLGEQLFLLGALLLLLYLAVLVQTVLHEGGHLLFGLWSGYRFSSFRVLNFMWIKENGRLRLRRMSLAGTGGQCLMMPPEPVNGKIPVTAYNLGGVAVNALTGLLCLAGYLAGPRTGLGAVAALVFAGIGFLSALVNGIPLRLGAVNNDGYNACSLGRDPEAQRAFRLQMQLNALLLQGKRLRELPEAWFAVPSDEAMKNGMVAPLGVFACNYWMDRHCFAEADALMARLLDLDSGIVDLHRRLLLCDRMTCALLRGDRAAAEAMHSKGQKKFMRSMKNFPSVIRTEYALALAAGDSAGAEAARRRLDACAKRYPYPSDIAGERELMGLVADALLKEQI